MERDAISKLLTRHGLQVTSQRLDIAEYVLREPQHVSAEQILAAMRQRGSRVSKATVYNTMNLFSERGLVRTVEIDPELVVPDDSLSIDEGAIKPWWREVSQKTSWSGLRTQILDQLGAVEVVSGRGAHHVSEVPPPVDGFDLRPVLAALVDP